MRQKQIPEIPLSQFCKLEIDCRDGRKDTVLFNSDAKKLYDANIIDYNLTNKVYCTPILGFIPIEVYPYIQKAKAALGNRSIWYNQIDLFGYNK